MEHFRYNYHAFKIITRLVIMYKCCYQRELIQIVRSSTHINCDLGLNCLNLKFKYPIYMEENTHTLTQKIFFPVKGFYFFPSLLKEEKEREKKEVTGFIHNRKYYSCTNVIFEAFHEVVKVATKQLIKHQGGPRQFRTQRMRWCKQFNIPIYILIITWIFFTPTLVMRSMIVILNPLWPSPPLWLWWVLDW